MNKRRNWFITGISSGLGKAITEAAIKSGDFVIGTFRNQNQVDIFNAEHEGKAFSVRLDVTNKEEIHSAFELIKSKFNRIDILVNNAGSGFAGAIEETSDSEARRIFDINFFGVLDITRKFLPLMREQKSGHIIQISSQAGIKATAGFGIYNASKFALEGFSEALAQELSPLGIKVSIIEPGPYRTSFAGTSFGLAENVIEEYNQTSGVFKKGIKGIDGKQEGDPLKAAEAIIELINSGKINLRLPLGKIAVNSISAKIESLQNDLESNKEIADKAVY
jgi:short-subunit dehydrogenase